MSVPRSDAEELDPGGPTIGTEIGEGVDLGRRRFFRAFGREGIHAAASVLGAAEALRREASAATGDLFGLERDAPEMQGRASTGQPPIRLQGPTAGGVAGVEALSGRAAAYRSPYRLSGSTLTLLDQRALPGRVEEVECHTAGEVANALRAYVVRGGPVAGQVAAYGLALTASRTKGTAHPARRAVLRGSAGGLVRARPASRHVALAVERLLARWDDLGESSGGEAVADAMRAEADAIATEATLDLGRLGRLGAAALAGMGDLRESGQPIRLLLHGAVGPLTGGLIGPGLAVVQALAESGYAVELAVTEGRPLLDGTRLSAWELSMTDQLFTVVADSAVGWWLEEHRPNAVLLGAESIAQDGSTCTVAGSLAVASIAASIGVPTWVCTPAATIDPRAADATALRHEFAGPAVTPSSPPEGTLLTDHLPPGLIGTYVTEAGMLAPPFAPFPERSEAPS